MNKKAIAFGLVAIMILSGAIVSVGATRDRSSPKPGTDFNGPHFNLNLIGKNKEMPGDYLDTDRHVMFIPIDTSDNNFPLNLDETNGNVVYNPDGSIDNNITSMNGIKITITQGEEFLVLDGDATDGYGELQLGPDKYEVYIAVKAKDPKVENAITHITGWVEAYDNMGALWYYISVGQISVSKAKNKWTDATDLLFVDASEDVLNYIEWQDANLAEPYPYFDKLGLWVFDYMNGLDNWCEDASALALDPLFDFSDLAYFWQVQNNGNKLIQIRFYPMD